MLYDIILGIKKSPLVACVMGTKRGDSKGSLAPILPLMLFAVFFSRDRGRYRKRATGGRRSHREIEAGRVRAGRSVGTIRRRVECGESWNGVGSRTSWW